MVHSFPFRGMLIWKREISTLLVRIVQPVYISTLRKARHLSYSDAIRYMAAAGIFFPAVPPLGLYQLQTGLDLALIIKSRRFAFLIRSPVINPVPGLIDYALVPNRWIGIRNKAAHVWPILLDPSNSFSDKPRLGILRSNVFNKEPRQFPSQGNTIPPHRLAGRKRKHNSPNYRSSFD